MKNHYSNVEKTAIKKTHLKKKFYALFSGLLVALMLLSGLQSNAQTVLAAGDLSILGFNTNADGIVTTKDFQFVTWKPLEAGTKIKFSTNPFLHAGVSTALGNYLNADATITWTATENVKAGTVIKIAAAPVTGLLGQMVSNTGEAVLTDAAGLLTSVWGLLGLNGGQLFAFQSPANCPQGITTFNGTLICGIGFQGQVGLSAWLSVGVGDASQSYLPIEISASASASLYFSAHAVAATYIGPRSGFEDILSFKAAVADPLNWNKVWSVGGRVSLNETNFTLSIPELLATDVKTDVSCFGGANGSITVTPEGGMAPYHCTWLPSLGTSTTVTGLGAGVYVYTITDANFTTFVGSVTIGQPTALSATTTQTNVSCFGENNGTATVAVSGGSGTYSYSWAPAGGTSATATNLSAGVYTCTITDAKGCQLIKSFIITQPLPIVILSPLPDASICSGSTTAYVLLSDYLGAEFSWTAEVTGDVEGASDGTGNLIGQTLTGNGSVKYTVTAKSATCSSAPKSFNVQVKGLTKINTQPVTPHVEENASVDITIAAEHALGYSWELNIGEGFAAINDGELFTGSNTATLHITKANGEMKNYTFRCVVIGACITPISEIISVDVDTRKEQTINFESRLLEYGAGAVDGGASSTSGLTIRYTSSDSSVIDIVNGKLVIKKKGTVVITAHQDGNEEYKPATPIQQTFTINPKQLTAHVVTNPTITKPYDGNKTAPVDQTRYVLDGVVEGDEVSINASANYADEKPGTAKDITINEFILSGASKDNYIFAMDEIIVKGDITRRQLTLTVDGEPVISKVYDGNDTAYVPAGNYKLEGMIGGQEVEVTGTAHYSDPNVGNPKTIYIKDFVLSGINAEYYEVAETELTVEGKITPRQLTVSVNADGKFIKTYDGTDTLNLADTMFVLAGKIPGDDVYITGVAQFDSKNAGEDKELTIINTTTNGDSKNNYRVVTVFESTTGTITKRIVVASLDPSIKIEKEFDGNVKATIPAGLGQLNGVVEGDHVEAVIPQTGKYDNVHAGTGKTVTVFEISLTGDDANNYALPVAHAQTNNGVIRAKKVQVFATNMSKVYGTADPRFTYTVIGLAGTEPLSGTLVREKGENVGTYKVTIGTLGIGADYQIGSFVAGKFTITPASLEIKVRDVVRKEGEVNPTFEFEYIRFAGRDTEKSLEKLPVARTVANSSSPQGLYTIEVDGAYSPNYNITYNTGRLTVMPNVKKDPDVSVRAWQSGPNTVTVSVYSAVPQQANLMLWSRTGQMIDGKQLQLAQGFNTITMWVQDPASGMYLVGTRTHGYYGAEKIWMKRY